MATLLCMLFPPLLLIVIRRKLKIQGGGNSGISIKDIVEYLLAVLFVNALVIAVASIVFEHSAGFIDALNHYMDFAFHYLFLAVLFSVLIPCVEHFVCVRIKINPIS